MSHNISYTTLSTLSYKNLTELTKNRKFLEHYYNTYLTDQDFYCLLKKPLEKKESGHDHKAENKNA